MVHLDEMSDLARERLVNQESPRSLAVPFELGRPFGAPDAPDLQALTEFLRRFRDDPEAARRAPATCCCRSARSSCRARTRR
jgi:hypothetical protein